MTTLIHHACPPYTESDAFHIDRERATTASRPFVPSEVFEHWIRRQSLPLAPDVEARLVERYKSEMRVSYLRHRPLWDMALTRPELTVVSDSKILRKTLVSLLAKCGGKEGKDRRHESSIVLPPVGVTMPLPLGDAGLPAASALSASLPGNEADTFVALDFETCDTSRDSAIALGMVRVEAGKITRRWFSLFTPRQSNIQFSEVHGLSWDNLRGMPRFEERFSDILEMLSGVDYVVAHNAAFDRSVLEVSAASKGLTLPPLLWGCTVQMARRLWPGGSMKLFDLANRIGLPWFQHHNALSDATTCAKLVLKAREIPIHLPRQASR